MATQTEALWCQIPPADLLVIQSVSCYQDKDNYCLPYVTIYTTFNIPHCFV